MHYYTYIDQIVGGKTHSRARTYISFIHVLLVGSGQYSNIHGTAISDGHAHYYVHAIICLFKFIISIISYYASIKRRITSEGRIIVNTNKFIHK
jgi:hypothetical protein